MKTLVDNGQFLKQLSSLLREIQTSIRHLSVQQLYEGNWHEPLSKNEMTLVRTGKSYGGKILEESIVWKMVPGQRAWISASGYVDSVLKIKKKKKINKISVLPIVMEQITIGNMTEPIARVFMSEEKRVRQLLMEKVSTVVKPPATWARWKLAIQDGLL
ncbi:hypothetical protein J6590_055540 [Homalodisca vitripennis]|nr:hypothetical protein J6590_055540 [Homalodisca vitripennis]